MAKYTITIEGDFEKGECWECPLAVNTYVIDGNYYPQCPLGKNEVTCPLEEATVAKNATTEEVPNTNVGKKGKWIRKIDDDWFRWVECSLCGTKRFAPRDFCPNCGADMRKTE